MNQSQRTQAKGVVMLLLTALIWGTAFVAQSIGMDSVECFTYSGLRTVLGAAVLFPFVFLRDKKTRKGMSPEENSARTIQVKKTIKSGILLGVIFFVAQNLQQYAFNYSTSGKIAFITALYMFFVPLLGLFLKKRIPLVTWFCILLGFVGLYFLCMSPDNLTAINRGDVLAFLCAIAFAIHILAIEKIAPESDGVMLSCVQFVTAGIISCGFMFAFEHPSIPAIVTAAPSILYAGIMSCGLAYTFQIIGQKYTEATVASMLMCLESVFAVIAGAIILHELLSGREILGCTMMFTAIVVSQVSETIANKRKQASL